LARFIEESQKLGAARCANGKPRLQHNAGHIADMIMIDAGLRMGEVVALRWGEGDVVDAEAFLNGVPIGALERTPGPDGSGKSGGYRSCRRPLGAVAS
jgi:hypothetical protein